MKEITKQQLNRALESCNARLNMFKNKINGNISDGHKDKLEKQIEVEEVKISVLQEKLNKLIVNNAKYPTTIYSTIISLLSLIHSENITNMAMTCWSKDDANKLIKQYQDYFDDISKNGKLS